MEEKNKKNEENEKKPIELPNIEPEPGPRPFEFAGKKPAPEPSTEEKPKPETGAGEKPAPEPGAGEKPAGQQPVRYKKPWLFIILVFTLAAALGVSIFGNIHLYLNMTDMKAKALSNAEVAKKMVAEKEGILEEQEPLREEVGRITRELTSSRNISDGLKRQNETLKTELAGTKKRFTELQNNVKEYADEVKGLISKRIKYYKAYEDERGNKEQLAIAIEKLESRIKSLNDELGSIGNEYMAKEAEYVYNMAFLYAKVGMFDEAIKSFKRSLELSGEDAEIHYNLAIMYDQVKKDKDQALTHYTEYLRLSPDAKDMYEIRARIESLERGTKEPLPASQINMNELKL